MGVGKHQALWVLTEWTGSRAGDAYSPVFHRLVIFFRTSSVT